MQPGILEWLISLLPRRWRVQYHYRKLYALMRRQRREIEDFRRWQ